MVYKVHHARSGGVLHGARPGWLRKRAVTVYASTILYAVTAWTGTNVTLIDVWDCMNVILQFVNRRSALYSEFLV
jgi:hypothetical protein